MYIFYCKYTLLTIFLVLGCFSYAQAQYLEAFDTAPVSEWRTGTGDGDVFSEIINEQGFVSIIVDATEDIRNVWWAIMQTTVSGELNLHQLSQPGYELRVEARIRSSHAPRRVNLHLNTQRTVDFHTHLMEFDIPDTVNWNTISMTTQDFDGRPGDRINAHVALMDWGTDIYRLDVDYFKVDVVNISESEPDLGEQVLYPPPVSGPDEFRWSEPVLEAGMIDLEYPDVNFSGWVEGERTVLTTDGTKTIILRWDLDTHRGKTAAGYGMLELATHSYYQATGTELVEFDKLRLVEILNATPDWIRESVTLNSFVRDQSLGSVLNNQMIIDTELPDEMGSKLRLHIPRPVIQRILDGRTSGIAIYPLGAMHASFKSGTNRNGTDSPTLYFNLMD